MGNDLVEVDAQGMAILRDRGAALAQDAVAAALDGSAASVAPASSSVRRTRPPVEPVTARGAVSSTRDASRPEASTRAARTESARV